MTVAGERCIGQGSFRFYVVFSVPGMGAFLFLTEHGQVKMVGGVPLGPGDKVAGTELPLALFLHKGIELPVDPDDLGREFFRNALEDYGVRLGGSGQSVLRHLNDGVDAHMHSLGGAVLIADNGLEGLHIALRVPAVGQLSAVGDVRVF